MEPRLAGTGGGTPAQASPRTGQPQTPNKVSLRAGDLHVCPITLPPVSPLAPFAAISTPALVALVNLGAPNAATALDHAPVIGLARAIQLSVAPVFLLTGISGLLGVLTNRLSRVIDRARSLQDQQRDSHLAHARRLAQDLQTQKRRMGLLNRGIQTATLTGLLVAAVVAVTFVSAMATLDLAAIVVPLFVVAMASLMATLLLLLLETQLASGQINRRF